MATSWSLSSLGWIPPRSGNRRTLRSSAGASSIVRPLQEKRRGTGYPKKSVSNLSGLAHPGSAWASTSLPEHVTRSKDSSVISSHSSTLPFPPQGPQESNPSRQEQRLCPLPRHVRQSIIRLDR